MSLSVSHYHVHFRSIFIKNIFSTLVPNMFCVRKTCLPSWTPMHYFVCFLSFFKSFIFSQGHKSLWNALLFCLHCTASIPTKLKLGWPNEKNAFLVTFQSVSWWSFPQEPERTFCIDLKGKESLRLTYFRSISLYSLLITETDSLLCFVSQLQRPRNGQVDAYLSTRSCAKEPQETRRFPPTRASKISIRGPKSRINM